MPPHPEFYDAHMETLPRSEIESLQEARLMQLVEYVYERSALVRATWNRLGLKPAHIRSLEDFREKAPFIDKDTIRRYRDERGDPFGGIKCVGPPYLRGIGFTSGTTGDPTPLPRTEDTVTVEALKREFWHIGARPNDYVTMMVFTFREGHNGDRWQDCGFRPIYLRHDPAELPRLFAANAEFAPSIMLVLSTPLIIAIDKLSRETDLDVRRLFACYKGVIFGGEPLGPRTRAIVESWGVEIFNYTALGDVTGAMECRLHDGMHTWEDFALVEHLDPITSEPVADGELGELVVTSLADDIAPLVRFRTDDLVVFTRKKCPCGRTHGRMKVRGRKGDEVVIAGKSIMPLDILPAVQGAAESAAGLFQVIRPQRELDVLRVRIGYDPELLDRSCNGLAAHLAETLAAELGVSVKVELQTNQELLKLGPPHKIPRVSKQ